MSVVADAEAGSGSVTEQLPFAEDLRRWRRVEQTHQLGRAKLSRVNLAHRVLRLDKKVFREIDTTCRGFALSFG